MTHSWAQVATVVLVCVQMGHAVDGSLQTAVTSYITPTSWCVCAAPATKVPGVTSAPPGIMGTLWCPAVAACPASVTTTLTCTTRAPAMYAPVPVSNVFTTPRAMGVSTANWVITATLPHRAAGSVCVTRWGRYLRPVRPLMSVSATSGAASVPASPTWSVRTATAVLLIPGTSPAERAASAATVTLFTLSDPPAMRSQDSVCANQALVARRVGSVKNSSGAIQRSNVTLVTVNLGESPATSVIVPPVSAPVWRECRVHGVTSVPEATRVSSPTVSPATSASLSGTRWWES